jgi:two-component system chemotaxis response regulator CheY
VLATGNRLPPFRIIDLRCASGYLRVISPHQRKPLARKILLADDSVTAQNMGRKILADAGYEVITVNNGSAALKKIAEIKPDLIVLDVYMPGYSGLEVCQRVKETGDTSRIPVLLTVGKLEPFKPEEAKRVRAEGFIVKPFEASELLSALTKLEDKMVPRSESSKPGRFARAIAAVEEGRYDKSMAVEEDSGWKNRIAFPSKKKRASAEQADSDDPPIYNAVNKDLRTVIDRPPAPMADGGPATETKVDLGALAPEGLPKDVTPEEIAALAAAAARIQGNIAEAAPGDGRTVEARTVEPRAAASVPEQLAASSPEAAREPAKIESGTATHAHVQPASEPTAEIVAWAVAQLDQKVAEERVAREEVPTEGVPEAASFVASSPADVMAAITSLETSATPIATAAGSGNGLSARGSATQLEAEPVTMAVAAGAEHAAVPSRWAALSVALAAEDAAINLEEDMRNAHASLAVADAPPVEAVASVPETHHPLAEPTATAEAPPAVEPEHQALTPAPVEPEATQISDVAANAATEATHAAVKEFETVTATPVASPAEPEPALPQPVDLATPPALEAHQPAETKTEEIAFAQVTETEPPAAETLAPPTGNAEAKHEELTPPEPSQPAEEEKGEETVLAASVAAGAKIEEAPSVVEKLETAESDAVSQVPAEQVPTAELSVPGETTHGGRREMAKKELDIAATTAAAWASWRRIRETGDPQDAAHPKNGAEEKAAPAPEETAMAVAAGAEKIPAEVPAATESPEIASIVDSVLADLRPKIVEEISRKLGKKK